jgi:hypothetical protein
MWSAAIGFTRTDAGAGKFIAEKSRRAAAGEHGQTI